MRWDTRYGCLAIRAKKTQFNWIFQRHNRAANLLADRAVRLAFDNNLAFYFVNPSLSDLHSELCEVLFSYVMGGLRL